jgi:hypothetical protein
MFQVEKEAVFTLATKYGELKVPLMDIAEMKVDKSVVENKKLIGYPVVITTPGGDLKGLMKDVKLSGVSVLGKADIPFNQIVKFHVQPGKKTVKLRLEDGWKSIGKQYRKVNIRATGTIDHFPQTPGQYLTGPKGAPSTFGGLIGYGTLMGRINGGEFVIGEGATTTETGTLEIRVAPPTWAVPLSEGFYEVTIE